MSKGVNNLVKVRLLENYDKNWEKPKVAKHGDAGIDLRNATGKRLHLEDGVVHSIPTGIAVEIPDGYCGVLFERSGHGKHYGTSLHGRVVDSGYRGEIFVLISSIVPFHVQCGGRLAQIIFVPVLTQLEIVNQLGDTERGNAGFGSSGIV